MTRVLAICSMAAALAAMAGCSATAPAAAPPPDALMVAPPVPAAAGNTKVGAGSKAGFCTFKDAAGKLYEAKC